MKMMIKHNIEVSWIATSAGGMIAMREPVTVPEWVVSMVLELPDEHALTILTNACRIHNGDDEVRLLEHIRKWGEVRTKLTW